MYNKDKDIMGKYFIELYIHKHHLKETTAYKNWQTRHGPRRKSHEVSSTSSLFYVLSRSNAYFKRNTIIEVMHTSSEKAVYKVMHTSHEKAV